jgi:hypothetical protein
MGDTTVAVDDDDDDDVCCEGTIPPPPWGGLGILKTNKEAPHMNSFETKDIINLE